MPAIDPERLSREIEKLHSTLDNPSALRQGLFNILEYYSDRIRRPGAVMQLKHIGKSFGVPRPVMRALRTALLGWITEMQGLDPSLGKELWQSGYREARLLAIDLLLGLPAEETLHQVEAWSLGTDDPNLLVELAQIMVDQWRFEDLGAFSEKISHWLQSKKIQLQMLALCALKYAVVSGKYQDLPLIFQLLRNAPPIRRSVLRTILRELMQSLIHYSASETARFLLDERYSGGMVDLAIIRQLLSSFPPTERDQLKRALST